MFVAVGYIAYIEYERQRREEELFQRGKSENKKQQAGGDNNKSHRRQKQRERRRLRRKIRSGRDKEAEIKAMDHATVDPFTFLPELPACGCQEGELLSPETTGSFSYSPISEQNIVQGESSSGNIDTKNGTSSTKKLLSLESDTFREDARAEWIRAVFGTEFPQRKPTNKDYAVTKTNKNNSWKGVGLAGISSYVAYNTNLELPQNSIAVPTMASTSTLPKDGQSNKDCEPNQIYSTTCPTDTQQPSLGMTLSRLSLGLYVRKVRPGSEAWCAGVEENSVLVGINDGELNLLAEPSKSALERIWQYEGYCYASTNVPAGRAKTSDKKNANKHIAQTSNSNTKMKIRNPISMTFIRKGKLYKVLFLSDPPYGIDWGPCGKFCLIQRVKPGGIADRAGVRPSSIVAGICTEGNDEIDQVSDNCLSGSSAKNTIYNLDHSSVAKILKYATAPCVERQQIRENQKHATIRMQLCFPPSEARSGHWERQQDELEEKRKSGGSGNSARNNDKAIEQDLPRPRVAAELDGVQVRVHPLLGGRGSLAGALRPGDRLARRSRSPNRHRNSQRFRSGCAVPPSLSKLAERVAAGENISILWNSGDSASQGSRDYVSPSSTGAEYGRFYRPCPVLKKSSSSSEIITNTQQSTSNKQSSPSSNSSSTSILDCWEVEQALIYVCRHHLAGYNELQTRIRASEDTAFFKVLSEYLQRSQPNESTVKNAGIATVSDVLSTFLIFWFGWLTAQDNQPLKLTEYLLKIVHQNQIIKNGATRYPCDVVYSHSSHSLAHHMEYLAAAFDNGDVRKSLRKLRNERQQQQYLHTSNGRSKDGWSKSGGNSIPSIRAVTGTTPTHHQEPRMEASKLDEILIENSSASFDSEFKPKSRSRRFRFLRKKKRRPEKTESFKNSKNAFQAKEPSLSPDGKAGPLASATGDDQFFESLRSKSEVQTSSKASNTPKISYVMSEVTSSKSNDALFGNTLWFLEELELVCADIEKSLMRSFSQKFARWALQPWTANKESALTDVTSAMRERLEKCNRNVSSMPLLDPIDSSFGPLSSIDSNECYILPSAHFPLLLTFNCKRPEDKRYASSLHGNIKGSQDSHLFNKSTTSILFGDERSYRTTIELVSLKGSRVAKNNEKLPARGFTVHGSVSGTVVESQQSVEVDNDSNNHIWDRANFMVFNSRSSWGPPQTLSLRLSEANIEPTEKDANVSKDSITSRISTQKECGYCWVDLSPYWDKSVDELVSSDRRKGSKKSNARRISYKAQVVPFHASNNFNEHGDLQEMKLPEDLVEVIEIELQITTKILESKSSVKRSLLYKHDDDVRQEMFAIEFMKACDRILCSCGLDMKMLIYGCVSVGKRRGFIEWVQGSSQLSEICQPFAGSILAKNKDQKEKLKSISIESNFSSETIDEGEYVDDDDDNITLSSVAKAGVTKYESLNRFRKDKEPSPKQSNSSPNYALPKNNNPIQDFLRSLAYDPNASYKIKREVMETYVKSCAGYSVCTYILGVGDRHLDNLLLHESGHFFHCDYSFILGKDPKKYLPMRITQDMINGMGGWKSDNFCQFLSLACAAFLTLRRPENVRHLLSLIRLLEGCGLPDLETTQTIDAAIQGVRDRLKLDLSDEDAIVFMEKLIQDSCSSKMWIAVDAIHSLAQKF